jgi:hypothetical protein
LKMIAEKLGTVIFIVNNKNLFFHKARALTLARSCDMYYTYEAWVKYRLRTDMYKEADFRYATRARMLSVIR